MKKYILLFSLFISLGMMSGCSSTPSDTNQPEPTAEELYSKAHKYLDKSEYKKAAETFETVELEHPYSKTNGRLCVL